MGASQEVFAEAAEELLATRKGDEMAAALYEASSFVLEQDEERCDVLYNLYFADDGEKISSLLSIHDGVVSQSLTCFWEWVLASASLMPEVGGTPPLELLRSLQENLNDGNMWEMIEEVCSSRLSLYEVQAVDGRRIQVLDLLAPQAEPVWVETSGSLLGYAPWDIAALRILALGGKFQTSLGVLLFLREPGLALARRMRREVAGNASLANPRPWGLVIDQPVIRRWIDFVLGRDVESDLVPELNLECLWAVGGEEQLRRRLLDWTGRAQAPLGGRTPAEVARLEGEHTLVVNMLKSFENQHASWMRRKKGKHFSFRFLWEALGLEPSMPSL